MAIRKGRGYYSVVKFAWEQREKEDNCRVAWKVCEKEYIRYNWSHAYPNAAAEIVALYFCDNDFDACLSSITMMGMDADCNAAQIMTLFGAAYGTGRIGSRWREPIEDEPRSYVCGYEKTTITAIAQKTVEAVKSAAFSENPR